MKNLPTILSAFIFLIFISCGSENVTNQNPVTGEEVIFSMDSFAINLENGVIMRDTVVQILNNENCRLSFDVSTNVDSIESFALYRILGIDSTNTFVDSLNNVISTLNATHSINVYGSMNFLLKISIQLNQSGTNTVFIRLRNLKIIRIPSH